METDSETDGEYESGGDEIDGEITDDDSQAVTWTASEFIAHDKSAGWYLMLAAGSLLLAGLVYLITRDFISVGVVIAAGLLLAIYGSHQPRQLEYTVNQQGIGIGQKHYAYDEFSSFAVVSEGTVSGLVFMPLRRFALPITIYYAPEDEEKIINVLADRLPLEEHRLDAVDRLTRRIRF